MYPRAIIARRPWIDRKMPPERDGPHCGWTPVVGWAQATTGRPPGGTGPDGTIAMPETAIGLPSSPRER
jgi:hypothetical protein